MIKKVTVFSLLLALVSFPVFAQDDIDPAPAADDDALPEGSVDVDLAFVSNYVFRGTDFFTNRASQKGESYGAHTGAWAFQPSINFNTPVEGLYFNIWGSFAMEGRSDQDTDGLLQTGPSGDSIEPTEVWTNAAFPSLTTPLDDLGAFPGYYREENGLDRLDEVDMTIGYEADTTVGYMGFGIVNYMQPNTRAKSGFALTEIFVSYALPFLPDLSLTMYSETDSSEQYYNLSYGSSFDIADGISLDYGVGVGYGVWENLKGVQDVTGSIGISAYGFYLAYNFAVRPNIAFHEQLLGEDSYGEAVPAWIDGESTYGDGLVADPSLNNGVLNAAVNGAIGNFLNATTMGTSGRTYSYTPRQKMPRTLWWLSVGYSFSI